MYVLVLTWSPSATEQTMKRHQIHLNKALDRNARPPLLCLDSSTSQYLHNRIRIALFYPAKCWRYRIQVKVWRHENFKNFTILQPSWIYHFMNCINFSGCIKWFRQNHENFIRETRFGNDLWNFYASNLSLYTVYSQICF